MVKISHRCDAVVSTISERFIAVSHGKALEMRVGPEHATWADECLNWIRNPTFPFKYHWPTTRYMDILSTAASEWVPKVNDWEKIPSQWFRNVILCETIWENLLEQNICVDWSYLPSYILSKWYQTCQKKIVSMITHFEYNQHVIDILNQIYKKVTIKNSSIREYCWYHHGRVAVIPILLSLTEEDHNCLFLNNISKEPITCDSILCFSPLFVTRCLKNDFLVYFIRCLIAYHREYPHKPTENMKCIFTNICIHIFDRLTTDNADIPLVDSGKWKMVEKLGPQHKGCYIRSSHMAGFITSVEITSESKKIYWQPLHRSRELLIDNSSKVSVWKFDNNEGPKTLLECALCMTKSDIWSYTQVIRPFKWFSSENGAFMSESCSIMIFKEAMRITQANWKDGVASFDTNQNLAVCDSDLMQIEWVVPLWSYSKANIFHIAPLKLKICHILSTTTRRNVAGIEYATELFQAIAPKTCTVEAQWNTTPTPTAIDSQFDTVIVGFQDGSIIEYATLSGFDHPVRTYETHPNAVIDIQIVVHGFISICEDVLCHFCLITGTKLMSIQTNMTIIGILPFGQYNAAILEAENITGRHGFITTWDFESGTRLKRMRFPINVENILISNNFVVTNNNVYHLTDSDIEHVFTLNVDGSITCIEDIGYGICGGTSEGGLFKINIDEQTINHWKSEGSFSVTCMAKISKSSQMLSGTSSGQITMWDHEQSDILVQVDITNSPITHIFTEGMFVVVLSYKKITLTTIVHDRCILAVHGLNSIIFWSQAWKTRLLRECNSLLKPTIALCLQYRSAVTTVFELLEECLVEYQDRAPWCKPDIIQIIAETIATGESPHAIAILTRIASYIGPKFNCVICNDEDCEDSISMFKTCEHRFHTGCIAELVRKVPEYHQEMQYEYALSVSLKCPSCRAPFKSEDIQLDTELNKYYNCT
jgi:hypothetical protein